MILPLSLSSSLSLSLDRYWYFYFYLYFSLYVDIEFELFYQNSYLYKGLELYILYHTQSIKITFFILRSFSFTKNSFLSFTKFSFDTETLYLPPSSRTLNALAFTVYCKHIISLNAHDLFSMPANAKTRV